MKLIKLLSDHHGVAYSGKEDAEQYYNETYK